MNSFTNAVVVSGNKLYSTLGNLQANPAVGIVVPDYETSDALFLTGHATILYGADAGAVLPRSNLAVRITVSDAKFIKSHLSFRTSDESVEYSPYNPPVRRLQTEGDVPLADSTKGEILAKLVGREKLTGSVNRYQFELEGDGVKKDELMWRAGQYVTLDFEDELSVGYAHMNDDDPQSLNEDYKVCSNGPHRKRFADEEDQRTFTISNVPGAKTMEITAKLHGPVTKFLSKHPLRVPLSIPVLGFGGQDSFSLRGGLEQADEVVFVAGGVGITPLLAQAPDIIAEQTKLGPQSKKKMTVLWSLRRDEVGLATDSFRRGEGLAAVTRVFLTGEKVTKEDEAETLRGLGAEVQERRMGEGDLREWKGKGLGFFACASGGMLVRIQAWLEGERLVWEEFAY
jgi:NAD(P)H-flavin reductase